MATQEDASRKRPVTNDPDKAPEPEEIPVAGEMSLEELGLSTRVVNLLREAGLETAQDILDRLANGEAGLRSIPAFGPKALKEVQQQLKAKGLQNAGQVETELEQENQVRIKTELEMHEAKEALVVAQAEPEREQGERNKAEKSGIMDEKAALETQEVERVTAVNAELPVAVSGEKSEEKTVSFVVRVTVDERGNIRRTEIKLAIQPETKDVFPDLDGQRLTTFIMKHVKPSVAPEVSLEPAVPEPIKPPAAPATILTVADIKIADNSARFVLTPDEPLVVESRFQLGGPGAVSLAAKEIAFEVKVYANSVASGKSTLLVTAKGNLADDELEYTTDMKVPGLSPGSYRLDTLVVLHEPANMVEYHKGPFIRVAKRQ